MTKFGIGQAVRRVEDQRFRPAPANMSAIFRSPGNVMA